MTKMKAATMRQNARKIAYEILRYFLINGEWDFMRNEVNNIDNLFAYWDRENLSEVESERRWTFFENEISRILQRIKP